MNKTNSITLSLVAIFVPSVAFSQGTFENLNFEAASLSPVPPNGNPVYVPESTALPDWTAALGTTPATQVLQNNNTFGEASVNILGPNYPAAGSQTLGTYGTLDGSYTVALQSGGNPQNESQLVPASISQVGEIPLGTESLQFKAWQNPLSQLLAVSFDGNNLPLVTLDSGPNYTLYGVDVSAYAGESGALEFMAPVQQTGLSLVEIDDISFSSTSTPEPNSAVLAVLGGLIAILGRRFSSRRT